MTPDQSDPELVNILRELVAELRALRLVMERPAAVWYPKPVDDDARAALLARIQRALPDRSNFTCGELVEAVDGDRPLLKAIVRVCGISDARAMGRSFKRMVNKTYGGRRLVRDKKTGDGRLWSIEQVNDDDAHASSRHGQGQTNRVQSHT